MKSESSLFRFEEKINNILDQSIAFTKSRVLLTAYELDIFTLIGENARSAKEIADEISANHNGVERLMNALVAMELLEKIGRKFRNSKASYTLLVRGNPHYMSNLNHMNFMWDRWTDLTEAVRLGTAIKPVPIYERSEKQINDLMASAHWRDNLFAPELVKMIDLSNVETILDLGCGTGAISMELIKQNPLIHLTLFDYPCIIERTHQHIERKSLGSQISVLKGDITKDDFGKGYDMVLISQVLHRFSVWENLNTLRKVFDALNPGGTVVIHEYLLSESRDKPALAALFSLNMLVTTDTGDVITETDGWLLLRESMFSDIKTEETSFGTYLIIGKK